MRLSVTLSTLTINTQTLLGTTNQEVLGQVQLSVVLHHPRKAKLQQGLGGRVVVWEGGREGSVSGRA